MKPNRQIRLRTIFLIFFCAAIGMTCASSPRGWVDPAASILPIYTPQLNIYHGLLYSGCMAIAIGLAIQALDLFKTKPPSKSYDSDLRFARTLAIAWRLNVAAMLILCLSARMFISRHILHLPDHTDLFFSDIFPDNLALILVIFVLTESLARWRRVRHSRPNRPWAAILAVVAGVILALIVLPDEGLITFLVHVAISNIEAVQRFHRPHAYPDPRAEGFRFFWLSVGAVAILCSAAAILFLANYLRFSRKLVAAGSAIFLGLLAIDVVFCTWFYTKEFYRLSIDMASVGFAANWFDWTSGAVLVSILASVAAYRLSVSNRCSAENPMFLAARDRTYIHESFWCLLLLFAATATFYVEEIRQFASTPSFIGPAGILGFVHEHLYYPSGYITLAIFVLSIQLCWIRWKRRGQTPELALPSVPRTRFLCNWLAVELLIVVAIPTIAIYCFAFWLGPWYLYRD
jgi:hypothetical protein